MTVADPTGGDAKWIWAPVAVDANADYTFSEYYMSDQKSVLIVEFNMADGTRQFTNLAVLSPASTWTEVSKEFNVRPGTVSVTVMHVLRNVGTLTIDDVSLNKLSDGTFSEGLVTLSYDDGYASFFNNVLPLLQSHNFVASENVVNDFLNQTDYMTTSQALQVNKDGIDIGSESLTHPFLTSLSDTQALGEIQNSRNAYLSSGLTPVSVFTYPYGDYNDNVENMVKNSGYIAARGTDLGYNTRNSNPYELRTENVETPTTFAEVKQWIDTAIQNKTWLILGLHDVGTSNNDGYEISTALMQQILDYLAQTKARVVTTDYVMNNLMH